MSFHKVYQDDHLRLDGEFFSDEDHEYDGYEYEEDDGASSGDECVSASSPKGRPVRSCIYWLIDSCYRLRFR